MIINSSNPILDKNLECIAKYNPNLVSQILSIKSLKNKISVEETLRKEPNLFYNGIPLHDQNGAEIEAQNAFSQITDNNGNSRHIIFGMGLGYLFQECCNKSKGLVFVYESNLEILRVTLEIVDFSKELSQNNVFVVSDIESFKQLYWAKKTYKMNYSMLILQTYNNFIYENKIEEIIKQTQSINATININYNVMKLEEFTSIEMLLNNFPMLMKGIPLHEITDFYKNKTALIISAGPTLDENLEIIKQNRGKVVIFCVGQAVKSLLKNNIKPDFVCISEQKDFSGQLVGCDLKDINMIIEPLDNNAFYQTTVNQRYLYITDERTANKFWGNITQTDMSKYFSGGSVSYQALISAQILGCNKLILVGQDLAYIDNKCYSKTSAYGDFEINFDPKNGKIEVNNETSNIESYQSISDKNSNIKEAERIIQIKKDCIKDTLCFVKGITGENLPSQGGYSHFIDTFSDFAKFYKNLELINTSMKGAQIDGFKNIPLENALERSPEIDKRVTKTNFNHDEKLILKKLINEISELKEIASLYSSAFDIMSKYENNSTKTQMDKALCVKSLSQIYDNQQRKNSILFGAIAMNETIELQFFLNETEDENKNKIEEIYKLLYSYFTKTNDKTLSVIQKLTETIDKLKG